MKMKTHTGPSAGRKKAYIPETTDFDDIEYNPPSGFLVGDPDGPPHMFPNEYFTSGEISKILGIAPDTFNGWLKYGFIKPRFREKRGKRSWAYFTKNQLYQIALFQKFTAFGVPRDQAYWYTETFHSIRASIEKTGEEKVHFVVLKIKSGKFAGVGVVYDDAVTIKADGEGSDAVVIDLRRITEKIEGYEKP